MDLGAELKQTHMKTKRKHLKLRDLTLSGLNPEKLMKMGDLASIDWFVEFCRLPFQQLPTRMFRIRM